jgi:hypothetical protein
LPVFLYLFSFVLEMLEDSKLVSDIRIFFDRLQEMVFTIPMFLLLLFFNILYWLKMMRKKCQSLCQLNLSFPFFEFLIIALPGFINLFIFYIFLFIYFNKK